MIRERFNNLFPVGSFVRSVGILTGATAAAQALAVLALPLLTRLYTPEDFELLAVYASILGIFSVVACLRYDIAIPIPDCDQKGFELLAISLGSAALVSSLIAIPAFVFPEQAASLIGVPQMESLIWLLPIGIFLAASYNALQNWALRMKRFRSVAITRVSRAAVGMGTQVGIGLHTPQPFGLVFGHMLMGGFGIFGLGLDVLRKDRGVYKRLRASRSLERLKEHYRFPVYSVPEALLNTTANELPIVLIASLAAGPEAGFVMLATRVIGLPMTLIGGSVAQVYLAEARHKLAEGTLTQFTNSVMWKLFRYGAIPISAVGFLSPFLFPLVFGDAWGRAGVLVAWMVPWFVLQFVASPISMILHVVGRQLWAAYLQAAGLVIRLGAVLIASEHFPSRIGETFAISGAIFYGLYILVILTITRHKS